MRVLLQARPDLLALPAGDTVQVMETLCWLRRLGVRAEFAADLRPDLAQYDLVHLFNLTRVAETAAQCENALRQRKPVAVSTIYWNPEEYIAHEPPRQRDPLLRLWRQDDPLRRQVAKSASILLPNAVAEAHAVARDLGVTGPFEVVPNGADPAFASARPDEFVVEFGLKDFVLCCARISPRKNQLALIRASRGLDAPVVFIGAVNDPFYLEACKREADSRHHFLPHMTQSRLASAYAAARVHALPSWFETPGLASLEAAMAGCNIVSTDRGTAREYFGELAWYCSPDDPESIARAVAAAYAAPRDGALASLVKERFTWECAARRTLRAYERVLATSRP